MKQKEIVLQNKGVSRDFSVSKASNEYAFENHNIRITARDHDTLLSVTNERGNKQVEDLVFAGDLVGWNVLNNYLILFTAGKVPSQGQQIDWSYIYRVKYDGESFSSLVIFSGALGFSTLHPIESIVDYETEEIQKIYWIDGVHVLRFMNFSDAYLEKHLVDGTLDLDPVFSFANDVTWFDSTKPASQFPTAILTKDNGGNVRANGTTQYFLTYYNKNGQQTGIIYSSPLVYLSPTDNGGPADGTNNNRVTLAFSGLDSSFEYVRLYQIVRTSYNGTAVAYIVDEAAIINGNATFIDDGTPQSTTDAASFLFLGSQEVIAGTMAHKDGTLFLGDLQSVGRTGIAALEQAIKANAFILHGEEFTYGVDWESNIISFQYSTKTDTQGKKSSIPYITANGFYPYNNQLNYTSAQISTFKGGEKYRFALRFFRSDGTYSKAFWIGDKVNAYYPRITDSATIQRAIALCELPSDIITAAQAAGFYSVQLMIAEANVSDRSVLAQGIVNPTVFNIYNRLNDAPYTQASWMFRPKGGAHPFRHLDSLLKADDRNSELQCVWWGEDDTRPMPLYYVNSSNKLAITPYGTKNYTHIQVTGIVYAQKVLVKYWGTLTIVYYENNTESRRDVYNIGGGAPLYNNSKLKLVNDWLQAYDKSDVPVAQRETEQKIMKYCADALSDATLTAPGTQHYYLAKMAIDFNSQLKNQLFANNSKEYYFVDENIVTLNSPEIEYGDVKIDSVSDVKFRIVGAAGISGNISDYKITTENFKYPGNRVLKYNFSKQNISSEVEGVSAWPLYAEYGYRDTNSDSEADEATLDVFAYMTYMWQKSGSIPGFAEENEAPLSTLATKVIANLRFAYYSVFNNYKKNPWSVTPRDVRTFDALFSQLYTIKVGSDKRVYSANVDDLVTMPYDTTYPVLYSTTPKAPEENVDLKHLWNTADPVRLSYNSRPHAVISLPSGTRDTLLPYLFSSDAFTLPATDSTYKGPFVPWKTGLLSEKVMYRDVYTPDATKVADVTEGSYAHWTFLEKSGGKLTAINSSEDTIAALKIAMSRFDKRIGNKNGYIHVTYTDNDDETLIVNTPNLYFESTEVRVEKDEGASYITVRAYSTDIPMKSVAVIVYGEKSDGTLDTLYNNTETLTLNEYEFYSVVNLEKEYSSYQVAYIITYKWTYEDDGDTEDVVPQLVRTNASQRLVLYGNGYNTVTHNRYAVLHSAPYIDPLTNTEEITFVDIAYGTYLLVLGTNHVITFGGYGSDVSYQPPTQKMLNLATGSYIPEGSPYLLIGELYKDYDEISKNDPTLDTRYGGISESAIEGSRFIAASEYRLLTEKETKKTYPVATLDCNELYNYIVGLTEDDTYTLNIAFNNGKSTEVIALNSISAFNASTTLPTSTDKTTKLCVVYDENSGTWSSDIEDLTAQQKSAMASDSSYKVVLLRFGYARRGKWGKYYNKYGEQQTTHTGRGSSTYKNVRRGYVNGLSAKRLRIIGNDLLISSLSMSQQVNSQTWFTDRAYRKYANATLVSSLGTELVLPNVKMTKTRTHEHQRAVTRGGHICNPSRDGLMDLFVGLYHKEQGEWKLASNVVQVRGRKDNATKLWEFSTDNVVYSVTGA